VIAGKRLHAEAVVEPIPVGFPWAAEMLGVTGEPAKHYVRALKIKMGSTPVGVPLSGYSDLGNLSRMWFEPQEKGARLLMEGNANRYEEGNLWSAELTIEDNFVVQRQVWLTEFPEYGAYETTKYVLIDD